MPGAISASAAKALVHAPDEVAFLDVREHGQYGEGHPFLAAPCPYSRLEHVIHDLVPRTDTPVVVIDDGDGVAQCAATSLGDIGYRAVSWIEGGAPVWVAAGYTLFKGVNLPSKTLGELLKDTWEVPHIDAGTLEQWQVGPHPVHLADGRPQEEYSKSTIPGSQSLPNCELPYRFDAAVADASSPVVVHCAGRTRSIVGAAGLALAGIPNAIFALEDGTQGWALSGRRLASGNDPGKLPNVSGATKDRGKIRAQAIARRYRIPVVNTDETNELLGDNTRTTFVLDVRTVDEFRAGTYDGARHAPGVQLVQATDHWIGVRRARVILTCDNGLRSAIAAVFLQAMNYETFILPDADKAGGVGALNRIPPSLPAVNASDALATLKQGGVIIDLRGSMSYRSGHLSGARWAIRPRLAIAGPDLALPFYLVGNSPEVDLVANDLAKRGASFVRRVEGDLLAWRREGLPIVETPREPSDAEAIDFLFFVHDRHDGNMESARRYLEWETGLIAQLDSAEFSEFRIGENPFTVR